MKHEFYSLSDSKGNSYVVRLNGGVFEITQRREYFNTRGQSFSGEWLLTGFWHARETTRFVTPEQYLALKPEERKFKNGSSCWQIADSDYGSKRVWNARATSFFPLKEAPELPRA